MSKIAFDLDGVFVPDCDVIPNLGGLAQFYQLTTHMRPLFEPTFEYDIITARNVRYKDVTALWCDRYLAANLPAQLYHDCTDESPSEYKAKVLNQNPQIQVYVESDAGIVDELKTLVTTDCNIILFKTFINDSLSNEN